MMPSWSGRDSRARLFTFLLIQLIWIGSITGTARSDTLKTENPQSVAPLLWQPSMNVFRRFSASPEKMFEFYGMVLGLETLQTIELGGGTQLARYRVGTSEIKLTGVVPGRSYVSGSVGDATGLRLLTLYFPDESALKARFNEYGYAAPEFITLPDSGDRVALVPDPDGQWLELVIPREGSKQQFERIEIGLTVSGIDNSRSFYRDFVGLEELPPVPDVLFNTTKYPYRHGTTIINLRTFEKELPADTGSAGIQYVVSDVDAVNSMATAGNVTFEQALRTLPGFSLRTVWLNDPDGITNYFAETAASSTRK